MTNRITSIVVGDDMVARFGIGSSLDLRDACMHIHQTYADTEKSKMQQSKDEESELMSSIRRNQMNHPKLYPPGKIIHIVPKETFCADKKYLDGSSSKIAFDFKCIPSLIHRHKSNVAYVSDQLTFSEIQISGTMFSDHMPQNVLSKIQELFPTTVVML